MTDSLRHFTAVWLVDFEFFAPPGERPQPLCLVAREFFSGQLRRVWLEDRQVPQQIEVGERTLFVAFYASAELGCYIACDWPMPLRVLGLFAEFRNITNGKTTPCGSGLLGA